VLKNYLFQVIKKELYIKVMYVMKSYDENLSLVEMSEKLYLKFILTNYNFSKLENYAEQKCS